MPPECARDKRDADPTHKRGQVFEALIVTDQQCELQAEDRQRDDLELRGHKWKEADGQQRCHPACDGGRAADAHSRGLGTGTSSSARLTMISADTESISASGLTCTRCWRVGGVRRLMSSGMTNSRPSR